MSQNPQDARRLADMSEALVLVRMLEAAGPAADAPVGDIGPGDDAAVLTLPSDRLVVSTDTLTEGQDFLRATTTAERLGRKAAVQNLADIAAMGARPLAVLSALSMPVDLPVETAAEITGGLAAACADHGVRLIGGDLGAAAAISLTVTAIGTLAPAAMPVQRGGARPGDALLLAAGHVGRSAAGLALVLGERVLALPGSLAERARDADARASRLLLDLPGALHEQGARALAWHNAPNPDIARGWEDTRTLTAMIDISDGLVRDAGRIARSSGTVIELDGSAVDALAREHHPLAEALDAKAHAWVLHGGEEHAMLATAAPQDAERLGPPWQRIGTVHPVGRTTEEDADSHARVLLDGVAVPHDGWDHFAPDVG